MGFHSFLQLNGVPLEGVMAQVWNRKIFAHIRAQADAASKALAAERGPCPDAADFGVAERFSNKLAIAPTASISIICGGASPGIEPVRGQLLHPQDADRLVQRAQPLPGEAARREGPGRRGNLVLDHAERGLGPASRFPQPDREGRLQDRLRARPALADRAGRREGAPRLPVPVAQPLPGRPTCTSATCTRSTSRPGRRA